MTRDKTPNWIPGKIRESLYPAVLELFSKNDFHQVGIREISERASLSSATIYKYFSSKELLLFTIIDGKITEIEQFVTQQILGLTSAKSIFRAILLSTMEFFDYEPNFAITVFITVPSRVYMQQPTFERTYNYIHSKILEDRGKENNELDPAMDARRFRDLYYMICYRVVYSWYYHGMKWKLVDAIHQDFELWWKMAANPSQMGNENASRFMTKNVKKDQA